MVSAITTKWINFEIDPDLKIKIRKAMASEKFEYMSLKKIIDSDEADMKAVEAMRSLFTKHILELQGFEVDGEPCKDPKFLFEYLGPDILGELSTAVFSSFTEEQEKKQEN